MRNRFPFVDRFSYLPLLCAVGCASVALAVQPHEPAVLEPGKTVTGELGGKKSAEYQFVLQKGQYAQVVVEQRTINVAIACFGPDGKELMAADTYWIGEPETAELIGDMSGTHRFRVTPNDPKDPAGQYTITLRSVEPAAEKHKYRVAAAAAYARASKEVAITPEQQAEMLANLKDALKNWHAAGDLFEEARSMYSLGISIAAAAIRRRRSIT